MIRKGEVRVNGGRIKSMYKLKGGDQLRVPPVTIEAESDKPSINLSKVQSLEEQIIYESNRVLLLNKPSGIAVHGGSGLSFGVIEALRSLRPDAHYLELVHRLDKETSGCLLIAKKRSALRFLHEQLRGHSMEKKYLALVEGQWPADLRQVDLPLGKAHLKSGERISKVSNDGKPSKTRYELKQSFSQCSLVEAMPVTGRTHQIRVHCAESGHPICGDDRYNPNNQAGLDKRLYLHAHQLTFQEQPDGPVLTLGAPLDDIWNETLNSLESTNNL